MNSDERQLITDLFDRMANHGLAEKDAQASALIADRVRAMPDAPYMMVQSVLVQEMALQQADERIRALEAQVSELEQRAPAAASGGGSFLGGLFGGGQPSRPQASPAARSGSVPAMGQRPMAGGRPQGGASSPWGNGTGGASAAGQAAQAGGGGGFMRSAMATAAGVAGGMLLADGIRNMMNGDAAKPATETAANDTASTDTTADQTDYQDAGSNDPGYQEAASYDDGGGDFGGDFDV